MQTLKILISLILFVTLLGVRSSGEILNDEMSLSSLSSGDEKILNSDGTKIEMHDDITPAPQFPNSFYPPPNFSTSDPYFAWRGMYGNNYAQPPTYPSSSNNSAFPNFNYPPPNGYPPYVDVAQTSVPPPSQNTVLHEEKVLDPHAATIE